jgi:hypothetical protein
MKLPTIFVLRIGGVLGSATAVPLNPKPSILRVYQVFYEVN